MQCRLFGHSTLGQNHLKCKVVTWLSVLQWIFRTKSHLKISNNFIDLFEKQPRRKMLIWALPKQRVGPPFAHIRGLYNTYLLRKKFFLKNGTFQEANLSAQSVLDHVAISPVPLSLSLQLLVVLCVSGEKLCLWHMHACVHWSCCETFIEWRLKTLARPCLIFSCPILKTRIGNVEIKTIHNSMRELPWTRDH